MLFWILVLLVLLPVLGGGYGYSRYGPIGLSPSGLILVVLVLLYLTGNLPNF